MELVKKDWCATVWVETFLTMEQAISWPERCPEGEILERLPTADHCLVVSGARKDMLQGFVPLVSFDSISSADVILEAIFLAHVWLREKKSKSTEFVDKIWLILNIIYLNKVNQTKI